MNKLISISSLIVVMSIIISSCNSSKASDKNEAIETTATTETTVTETNSDSGTTSETEIETASSNLENKTAIKNKVLTVTVSNLTSATSPVIISVYNSKNKFLGLNTQLKTYKVKPTSKTVSMQIKDIKYGEYAIALYQDVNNNGHIDKNFIGVPTEGYGFSNNIEPSVKAPSFTDCKFDYSASANTVKISLIQ